MAYRGISYSPSTREDLNRRNLRQKAGLLVGVQIEEDIYTMLRADGLGGEDARRVVCNGGHEVGNAAYNRRRHVEGRIFQHAMGMLVDDKTNNDPDSGHYHKEQYRYILEDLKGIISKSPKDDPEEIGVVSKIVPMNGDNP
jgi:hypothetical protein